MSKVLKVLKVITGQYTNAEGTQKNRYTKIGSIIETKNGPMLKLDNVPMVKGGWDGWAYINEPDDEQSRDQPRRASRDDDDIPF